MALELSQDKYYTGERKEHLKINNSSSTDNHIYETIEDEKPGIRETEDDYVAIDKSASNCSSSDYSKLLRQPEYLKLVNLPRSQAGPEVACSNLKTTVKKPNTSRAAPDISSATNQTSQKKCYLYIILGLLVAVITVLSVTVPVLVKSDVTLEGKAKDLKPQTTLLKLTNLTTRIDLNAIHPNTTWGTQNQSEALLSDVTFKAEIKPRDATPSPENISYDPSYFYDCAAVYKIFTVPGLYRLNPNGSSGFIAHCDHGWTTILNRFDGSQDFNLPWDDYKVGFGNRSAEHWLGNEHMYHLTNQRIYKIKSEFTFWDTNEDVSVEDHYFRIESEENKYKLHVLDYRGPTRFDAFGLHTQAFFSTWDRDNDGIGGSCAQKNKGGFWYKDCVYCNPTGTYQRHMGMSLNCMFWKDGSKMPCLSKLTMKIQPL